ncbi:Pyruvate dehydrogenase E1 component beta subunit [Bosea sp. 62]|uniref:alpha-ketoacid dehydrogenase subunit beta n=1 Tax=unclassified Bosea (in: a-proteobacteria) TaxID=2653178 RepID=UPI00125A33AA|nr:MULTISPECIES: alpha-ketoacid dehydrogenase subunit beta [unclassified Bosea (in: a-proteobacteria)]CAD5256319.1 Pyruvate dehydrogenase E1 component beta subunit [Bosea sp. 7B]CAD5274256.1 Pyruvate dehydrogenase E1 component beta subunit [Bosea sp. 21B]CAD5275454.1 Pyruvate dehydrogenase E1 component beta subunit [Bosea sp. 46]VVT60118.1 Pyruvate dehydrogenase E1 component beta subunit [Bosea sp. EC-HK365B]VXB56050.1 Pyruvate dehydrogenase E1 component beta subunit [Bosea sp. 62]
MAMMRYAEALRSALREEMQRDPSVWLMGEDIAVYGGVFKVSKDLMEEFGPERVRDTPISEQTLTAMAVTAAMAGTRPVLEIMYADFLPLSIDALMNQASIYNYIWNGQVTMPFVLRTQGGGGAGAGAQHSKSLDALVAHIPGLKVVAPATAADAKGLLKAAIRDDHPVIFLEHKLLYNTRDEVPDGDHLVEIGKARIARAGSDVSIIASSKMVVDGLKAADELAKEGISAEVVDLRTLRPLDRETIKASITRTHHAVVVNEGWRFCGYAAELSATIMESCFDDLDAPVERVATHDIPIPYSEPLESTVLPDANKIAAAARRALA